MNGFDKSLQFGYECSSDTCRALENIYQNWSVLDNTLASMQFKSGIEDVQWCRNVLKQRIESFLLLNGCKVIGNNHDTL